MADENCGGCAVTPTNVYQTQGEMAQCLQICKNSPVQKHGIPLNVCMPPIEISFHLVLCEWDPYSELFHSLRGGNLVRHLPDCHRQLHQGPEYVAHGKLARGTFPGRSQRFNLRTAAMLNRIIFLGPVVSTELVPFYLHPLNIRLPLKFHGSRKHAMSVIGAPTNLLDRIIDPEDLRRNPSDEELAEGEMAIDRFVQAISNDAENVRTPFCMRLLLLIFAPQCWKASPKDLVPGDIFLKTFLYHVDSANVPKIPLLSIENDPSERAWASFIGLEHKFVSQFPRSLISVLVLLRLGLGSSIGAATSTSSGYLGLTTSTPRERISGSFVRPLEGDTRDKGHRYPLHATLDAPCSPACSDLLHNSHTPSQFAVNEIVTTSGDKPEPIAQLAVNRLRIAMNESPMRPVHVSALAFALIVISHLPATASPTPSSQRTPPGCPRWIGQSLDAGLLRAICELAPVLEAKLHQFGKGCIQHILRDTLPKHMVYLSVVKLVDREMSDIDEVMVEAGVQRSWLCDDWFSLMDITSLRSAVAKLPKYAKGAAQTPCESTKCGKSAPRKELRRLHRMHLCLLLSKKCQKDAWPNHLGICKLKNERRSRDGNPQHVHQFFRELFSTGANHHLAHLHKLAKREFPTETQGEHFALCLDYTNMTYPTGTCSLKDIRTYTFPPLNREEADPANVVAQNDELIKMVRRNPKAYNFIEATFAWGERRISRNFMIRPNIWAHPGTPMLNWAGKRHVNTRMSRKMQQDSSNGFSASISEVYRLMSHSWMQHVVNKR
ncbi:hypothetical protein B0H13DRAFT_2291355 [Mycena leptocephala]|nr:hypothetical protein B0H13DRAFT_2291355 [Mycena leptocephala]